MDRKCVNYCEFLKDNSLLGQPPACIFYGVYLKVEDEIILRDVQCIDDEKKWAIEQTIKEVGNGFIQI